MLAQARPAWAAAQARFEQGFGRDRAAVLGGELACAAAAADAATNDGPAR